LIATCTVVRPDVAEATAVSITIDGMADSIG
jgi:hypothetical protein